MNMLNLSLPRVSGLCAAMLLALVAAPAQAVPVVWTLEDIEFEDGGTATGSFVYDRDTNTFSSIAITTTTPALAPLNTYSALLAGGFNDQNGAELVEAPGNQTGQPLLQLIFMTSLTNLGGAVALVDFFAPPGPSAEATCLTTNCSSASFGRAMMSGGIFGEVQQTVVPLPAAGLLLSGALGVLSAFRRRKA